MTICCGRAFLRAILLPLSLASLPLPWLAGDGIAAQSGIGANDAGRPRAPARIGPDFKAGLSKIKHVIVIMQENRSFDSYFGTYPGADGIPPGTCVPIDITDPQQGCVAPFHDEHDVNGGGPHGAADAQLDIDDGITQAKMDGFLTSGKRVNGMLKQQALSIVGYHTADEIPNYWAYAQNFVLQDRMFEGVRSYSLPSHLDMVSEWSATCTDKDDAKTCTTGSGLKNAPRAYPWASLFQLLDLGGISWKYYLGQGQEPDCEDGEMTCAPVTQTHGVLSIWNPAPGFSWVKQQGPDYVAVHNPDLDQFLLDIKSGTLPAISWIVPAMTYSEHPVNGLTAGMEYVTSLVNAVMQSPYWADTAIFISWDDWGGFYDHVPPPVVDYNDSANPVQGFGLRVPGIMLSPYAKAGTIDHSLYSFDSYATFIENVFLGGTRLDPAALGNPDSRPTIRDALTSAAFNDGTVEKIGSLANEFDFHQKPLRPLLLSTHIPTGIKVACHIVGGGPIYLCTDPIVTISWNPVAGPDIPGPFTYHVSRDGTKLPQCVTTSLSCTDTPPSGNHFYRAWTIDANGKESPASAAAEADEP